MADKKADGSVYIDTKIDTSNITKIGDDIQAEFKDLSKRALELSREINKALNAIDASGIVGEINSTISDIETQGLSEKISGPIQEAFDNVDASELAGEIQNKVEEGFEGAGQIAKQGADNIQNAINDIDSTDLSKKIHSGIEDGFQQAASASDAYSQNVQNSLSAIGKEAEKTSQKVQKISEPIQDGLESLDFSEFKQDLEDNLQEAFDRAAQEAAQGTQAIQKEVDDLDFSDLAEEIYEEMSGGFKESEKAALYSADEIEKAFADLPDSYQTIFRKLKQIRDDDTLDQKDKIDQISDMYEILGQDHEQAQRKAWNAVKSESAAGSRAIIDNLNDISREARETGEDIKGVSFGSLDFSSLDGLADSIGQQLGDMVGGSLGSALGGAFGGAVGSIAGNLISEGVTEIAGALVDFGKESMQLASDLQEVQNVVDVTFTTMSDDVNKFAQDAMRSAGLSETAAKQYTGTFGAMAKSFGFSEKSVYSMSTSLTQLTGDIASFYNMDHEEAAQKLSAVFTGETESLKELGIVMTQTALDSYAMEQGFGKTTSEMTEQEKVALRYQYVLDGLSDAQGDYSRTQDSWANQTKLLSQQWDQLKESIGALLIEALDPIVAVLNTLVLPALNAIGNALQWLSQHFFSLGDVISGAMGLIEDLFTPPEEEIQKRMTDSIDTVRSEVEQLGDEYTETADKAAESTSFQIGLFDELNTASKKTRDEIIKNLYAQGKAFEDYEKNLAKLAEFDIPPEIIEELAGKTEEEMQIVNALAENLDEESAQSLKRALEYRQDALAEANASIAQTLNSLSSEMQKTAEEIEESYSETADAVEDKTIAIQGFIDGLHGTTVDIVFNYQTTGRIPFVESYENARLTPSFTSYAKIPYLAEGAVIPPNAPFMAVLGDQRHGTNIEAPADLIRQIVREEMEDADFGGDINITFGGDLAGLASILAPVITREQRRNNRAGGN